MFESMSCRFKKILPICDLAAEVTRDFWDLMVLAYLAM